MHRADIVTQGCTCATSAQRGQSAICQVVLKSRRAGLLEYYGGCSRVTIETVRLQTASRKPMFAQPAGHHGRPSLAQCLAHTRPS